MSRYKLTISCEFDTAHPMSAHTEAARGIIDGCCPSDFDLDCKECMIDCKTCWFNAIEKGVGKCAESVHIERVD